MKKYKNDNIASLWENSITGFALQYSSPEDEWDIYK